MHYCPLLHGFCDRKLVSLCFAYHYTVGCQCSQSAPLARLDSFLVLMHRLCSVHIKDTGPALHHRRQFNLHAALRWVGQRTSQTQWRCPVHALKLALATSLAGVCCFVLRSHALWGSLTICVCLELALIPFSKHERKRCCKCSSSGGSHGVCLCAHTLRCCNRGCKHIKVQKHRRQSVALLLSLQS